MLRIAVALWLVLVGVVAAQQTANEPRFTGKSVVMDAKDVSAGRRSFEPGARTYWHSHDKGQLLLVEQGRMRTQKKGGPVRDLGVGESEYAGPNVVHWHGAAPNEALVQVNVGFGGSTKWLDAVTDAEYNKK
jgi:quercetin dioxygenase-like cupin family protein